MQFCHDWPRLAARFRKYERRIPDYWYLYGIWYLKVCVVAVRLPVGIIPACWWQNSGSRVRSVLARLA